MEGDVSQEDLFVPDHQNEYEENDAKRATANMVSFECESEDIDIMGETQVMTHVTLVKEGFTTSVAVLDGAVRGG